MRIRLAIAENDESYLNRIVSVFTTKYSDKLEVFAFTDIDMAIQKIPALKVDVVIAGEGTGITKSNVPAKCGFAYFTNSMDVTEIDGSMAISKFQKADLIYKDILNIYSEYAAAVTGVKLGDEDTKVFAFASPSGGVGTSSLAAACAVHFAQTGAKTLYINLEKYGSADVFFSGEGQFSMYDVIYAIKSQKANLYMKVSSTIREDSRGVFYIPSVSDPMYMREFKNSEIQTLISEIVKNKEFKYIILDMDFDLSDEMRSLYKNAHALIMCGDGSETSNEKVSRTLNVLRMIDESSDVKLMNRLTFAYNKASNKVGTMLNLGGVKELGGAPRFEHASTREVVDALAGKSSIFDSIY